LSQLSSPSVLGNCRPVPLGTSKEARRICSSTLS
uniref:Kinesin motor domain-containing protein n=1 Tax=Haemonchus placei TaxID=6290 RepID=A0A0N4VSB6_HAEPC